MVEQHPFDLSFTEDYLSNEGKGNKDNMRESAQVDRDRVEQASLVSSIISSDSSIQSDFDSKEKVDPLQSYENSISMIMPSLHKISSKEQMVNRVNESKDVDKKIRRMLTADFSKGSVYHQESNESIYTEKQMDNFKKQVDLLSNLQPELMIKKKAK